MPPSNQDDLDRIEHIVAECQFLLGLKSKISRQQLQNDEVILRAICYSIVIIGEACHFLTPEYKVKNPAINWKLPYQMRNFLVHQYDSIRLDTIWGTISKNIPLLYDYLKERNLE